MPSYPSAYYVYLLTDPKTGVPFYCGKGQKDRAWQHARAVGRGDLFGNARKVAKIQEILMRGEEVEIQIVAEYELEDDAYEHEFGLVDSMPYLTNVAPGGGGGRTLTEQEVRDRISKRLAKIAAARKAAKKARIEADVEAHTAFTYRKYESVAKTPEQAEEIRAWLRSMGSVTKVSRKTGAVKERLSVRNSVKVSGGKDMRARRHKRESDLVQSGKFVEITLPNGEKRLQSAL